jgi:hypothetical protein
VKLPAFESYPNAEKKTSINCSAAKTTSSVGTVPFPRKMVPKGSNGRPANQNKNVQTVKKFQI